MAGEVVPLVVCGAQRVSLSEKHLGKELPLHSVHMGRSWGSHGNPGGWRNPFKAEARTEQSRAAVVLRYRENLRSPSGRWVRYRLHELVGKKCFCHCSLDEVCHVDEILKVMDDEQRARAWEGRPPDFSGMSLAEVGLALKSHFLAPRSESAASVENFVLRHSGLKRGETPKDILPFALSTCSTKAEMSLSLETERAQLGQAEEPEAALDEFIQEAHPWCLTMELSRTSRRGRCRMKTESRCSAVRRLIWPGTSHGENEAGLQQIASSNLAWITHLRTSVQMWVFAAANLICGHVVKAGLIAALSSSSGATRHYSR